AERHAEQLSGFRLVVTGLLEGADDRVALDVFECLAEFFAGRHGSGDRYFNPRCLARTQLEIAYIYNTSDTQRCGAFEDVLELAHVAWEVILPKCLQRCVGDAQ